MLFIEFIRSPAGLLRATLQYKRHNMYYGEIYVVVSNLVKIAGKK